MLLNNYANTLNQGANLLDDNISNSNPDFSENSNINLRGNNQDCRQRFQNNLSNSNNINQNNPFFGNPSFSTILFFILILLVLFFFNNNNN